MIRRSCVLWIALVQFLVLPAFLSAQQAPGAETQNQPVPYEKEEFSPWLQDLNRGKNLAFGAFPFAYLLANLGYDIAFYTSDPVGNAAYVPWPVGPGTGAFSQERQNEKYKLLISVSAVLAVGLAVADYFMGQAGVDDGGLAE